MSLLDTLLTDAETIAEDSLPGAQDVPKLLVALVKRVENAVPGIVHELADTLAPPAASPPSVQVASGEPVVTDPQTGAITPAAAPAPVPVQDSEATAK